MSRISVGCLGLVLAAPIVLVGIGTAIFGVGFSDKGPPMPDPSGRKSVDVIPWGTPVPAGKKDPRTPFSDLIPPNGVRVTLGGRHIQVVPAEGSPPIRNIATKEMSDAELKRLSLTMDAVTEAEARQGRLFDRDDAPILVGDVLVYFEQNQPAYPDRHHLKRGIDWETTAVGALIVLIGGLVYLGMRAAAWVLNGFLSRPPA